MPSSPVSSTRISRLILTLISAIVCIGTIPFMPAQVQVQAQTEKPTPRFESSTCKFREPSNTEVDCGWLYVPENRRDPSNTTQIRLAVAIMRASDDDKEDDPIIYLEGGPGGQSLESARYSYGGSFSRYGNNRDFIMFDQRGVGLSEPTLECTETDAVEYKEVTEGNTVAEREQAEAAALAVCRNRLTKEGIDVSAYNSYENAADVEDLRIALEIDSWNLYGISYGTRLALTVMRDYPDSIRSVILDSTYPLQVNLYTDIPSSADRAFNQLFEDCGKDRACNRAYPKLKDTFEELIADLNADPVSVKVPDIDENVSVLITGSALAGVVFQLMYVTSALPYIPQLIYQVKEGEYDRAANLIYSTTIGDGGVSTGMYYSVQCSEEVAFLTLSELEEANSDFGNLTDRFSMASYYDKCQNWDVPRAEDLENEAVTSDVPTLIMAGQYDPITPPAYGELAGETLSNSYFFEFPGVGHGASVAGRCPRGIVTAFLTNPTRKPASSCIRNMTRPRFVTS